MKIDGIYFDKEWAKGKSEADFVAEFKDSEHVFPGPDKEVRLKMAYDKLVPQPEKPAPDLKKK